MSQTELQTLHRVTKASSERVDTVRRAKALLAVAAGESFTQAGRQAGLSREGVSQLVERFNQRGLASLVIASGRGRKPTYAAQARTQVVQAVQQQPDRLHDQTATWSLKLLQRALRRAGLPSIGATTIGRILHEEGFSLQRDRCAGYFPDQGAKEQVCKDFSGCWGGFPLPGRCHSEAVSRSK